MRAGRIIRHPLDEKRTLTSLHLFAVLRHVVWSNRPQELNVVITVVFCHLFTTGFVWSLGNRQKGNEKESDSCSNTRKLKEFLKQMKYGYDL